MWVRPSDTGSIMMIFLLFLLDLNGDGTTNFITGGLFGVSGKKNIIAAGKEGLYICHNE